MNITKHAMVRWNERFNGMNIEETYKEARHKLGVKMRKKVRLMCPAHSGFCGATYNGRYLRKTKDGIVFVIGEPETIITVMDFRN